MMDHHMHKMEEHFPLFRRPEWQAYYPGFQVIDLAAGEVLFTEGDVADGAYFVLSGRFAVQQKTGFVDKRQVVALLAAGSIIGEAAMAGQSCRRARVVATEKSTVTLMPVQFFAHLAEQQPSLAIDLLTTLLQISSLRLQKCSERLALVLW